MAEYDIALDNQVEWASFWTSDYGMRLFGSIGRAVSKKRAEAGEKDTQGLIDQRHDEALVELMPIINGECFYWARDMVDLVSTASRSLPDSWYLMKEHIPSVSGFFWMAKEPGMAFTGLCALGWTLLTTNREDNVAAVHVPQADGSMPEFNEVALIMYLKNPEFPAPIPAITHVSVGQNLSSYRTKVSDELASVNADMEDFTNHYQAVRLFASMLSFIQQRIMAMTRIRASRATVRRVSKVRNEAPEINIVKLRRVVHHFHEGDERAVEWNCQWIVRGHWRDQWYPSIRRNQPIWITPYVKGPEDKPLRKPETLFAVVR